MNGFNSARAQRLATQTKILLSCVFFITIFPVIAQDAVKRNAVASDYKLWSYLNLEGIDDRGKWISYSLNNSELQLDTLFVAQSNGNKKFAIAGGNEGIFKNEFFVCKTNNNEIQILNPSRSIQKTVTAVNSFQVSSRFVIVESIPNQNQEITFYDQNGVAVHHIPFATTFGISPNEKELIYIEKTEEDEKVWLINLENPKVKELITKVEKGRCHRIEWSESGNKVAFLMEKKGMNNLLLYDRKQKKLYTLKADDDFFKHEKVIIDKKMVFSKNEDQLFFYMRRNKPKQTQPPVVQVWNAADPYIYPKKTIIDHWKAIPHVAMWEPKKKRLIAITDTIYPYGGPVLMDKFALVYNPIKYEPQTKVEANRDVFILDLKTEKKELLVANLSGNDSSLSASPNSFAIAYFQNEDWFLYLASEKHTVNLTRGVAKFWQKESYSEDISPFGLAGWTSDGLHLLLYDENDVWSFNLKTAKGQRLTRGLESKSIFRLVPDKKTQERTNQFRISTGGKYNLKESLTMTANKADFTKNGYFTIKEAKHIQCLTFVEKSTKQIHKAANMNTYIWTEEDCETPSKVMIKEDNQKPRMLIESNIQQNFFLWEKMEVVSYSSPNGKPLRGLLYYPADYHKEQSYPLIVSVYEVQSSQRYSFSSPSMYNGNGFNRTNFTTSGYFVLLPDIVFETKDTGNNALQCVNAAVDAVLELGVVDRNRMGIIGHSFGGYETDYIITKTNRFACAVAGAAFTNLISATNAVARAAGKPNFFKIENGQARMNGSLYTEKQRYIANSPVFFADQVTTPLLSWTGLEDTQVEATQSFEFHMAMRRTSKKNILLAYPNEAHNLESRVAMADLTTKVQEWMDYYLKKKPLKNWMKDNF